jgi:hypothetical protein
MVGPAARADERRGAAAIGGLNVTVPLRLRLVDAGAGAPAGQLSIAFEYSQHPPCMIHMVATPKDE